MLSQAEVVVEVSVDLRRGDRPNYYLLSTFWKFAYL